MDLTKISQMQIEADERHGFPVRFDDPVQKYQQITKDLVGLFGEIGEFSNIVKKANIKLEKPLDYEFDFDTGEVGLREELVDGLIYIIRLGAILGMNLEDELLKKMRLNDTRYAKLRRG